MILVEEKLNAYKVWGLCSRGDAGECFLNK
jgi:hypothetical protein